MDDHTKFIFDQLCHLAMTGQPTDICTYSGKVILDAKIKGNFLYALMYGGGPKAVGPLLAKIEVESPSGTDYVSLPDIWIFAPMPLNGLAEGHLQKVNLADGDQRVAPSGKTIKEIIREAYRPKDDAEAEFYLRRFLAS